MKWFRMYSEVLHDPKVQRLTPAMFKHWVNLLCLANEGTPRGVLPSTDDIAFALRIKPQEAARIVADLVKLQLLELTPDGRAIPHNWTERQRNSDDVAARVARHRARDMPQSPPPQGTNHKATNGYVTLQETLAETLHTPQSNSLDKDREKNRTDQSQRVNARTHTREADSFDAIPTAAGSIHSRNEAAEQFTAFWQAYPLRRGVQTVTEEIAFNAFVAAVPRSEWEQLHTGTANYAASDEVARGIVKNADNFLINHLYRLWQAPEIAPEQKGPRNGYEARADRNDRNLRALAARWQGSPDRDADHEEPTRLPA